MQNIERLQVDNQVGNFFETENQVDFCGAVVFIKLMGAGDRMIVARLFSLITLMNHKPYGV